jgi:prepilin-type N-terminal cleavage/methylation domain-containing protein
MTRPSRCDGDTCAGLGRGKPRPGKQDAGFSLLELIVAMAVFLTVSAASFTLFSRHETLLSQEQGIAGLNIGLRNAISQIQMDTVNGAMGLLPGANVSASPVGVTIVNSNPIAAVAPCDPTPANPVYTANCFDRLNIIVADPNASILHPVASFDTSLTSTITTTIATAGTSTFNSGDQILIITGGLQAPQFTTVKLTAPGQVSGNTVMLNFLPTQLGGTNSITSCIPPSAAACNDPFSMTTGGAMVNTSGPTVTWVSGSQFPPNTTSGSTQYPSLLAGQTVEINGVLYKVASVSSSTSLTLTTSPTNNLTNVPFFSGSVASSFTSAAWVLRLLPIQYWVSVGGDGVATASPTDPQLVRAQAGVTNVVMDQVVGFKVGAATWNSILGTLSNIPYCYNSSTYCDPLTNNISGYGNDFTQVRAVRVSLIGRTTPSTDPAYTYENSFDHGHYQIRGNSIIVDPRNLTMNNN